MSMGVYIKGVEMPTDCAMLLKIFPDGRVGVPVHLNWMGTMVVNDAEAVPVPPHGKLIDADEFLKRAIGTKCFRGDYALMIEELVGESPTIIQAEEGE